MYTCQECGFEFESTTAPTVCPKCRANKGFIGQLAGRVLVSFTLSGELRALQAWESLLEVAEQFFANGEPTVAVIMAQSACEVILQRAAQQVFVRKGVSDLGDIVMKRVGSFTITDGTSKSFYKALTGDTEITSNENNGFWKDYHAMVELRNDIVHQGIRAQPEQAKTSVEAAKKFVAHVAKHNGL